MRRASSPSRRRSATRWRRVLRALPERLLRAPGGEEDWNVAQAFAHTTAARRFLATWAALDAAGQWPEERPPVVMPSVPGRADASVDQLLTLLDKSRAGDPPRRGAHRRAASSSRCLMKHPLIGHLRCGEWLLFVGVHDLHAPRAAPPAAGDRRAPRPMPERPAPLVLVTTPAAGAAVRLPRRHRRRRAAPPCGRPVATPRPARSGGRPAAARHGPWRAVPLGPLVHGRGARTRCVGAAGRVDAIGYAGGAGARLARRRRARRAPLPDRRRGRRKQPLQRRRVRRGRRPGAARWTHSRAARPTTRRRAASNEAGFAWRDLGRRAMGPLRRRHDARPGAAATGDPPARHAAARRLGARLPGDGAAAGRPALEVPHLERDRRGDPRPGCRAGRRGPGAG